MAGFLPDTSCLVAAVCSWHVDHEAARAEIERRLDRAEPMFVAAPAAVEAYAVLTRLPPPHRLAPGDALALLDANFLRQGQLVALDARAYRDLLRQAPKDGLAGGRVYDAVIATCALRVRPVTLLTFNAADFDVFARPGLEIVTLGRA